MPRGAIFFATTGVAVCAVLIEVVLQWLGSPLALLNAFVLLGALVAVGWAGLVVPMTWIGERARVMLMRSATGGRDARANVAMAAETGVAGVLAVGICVASIPLVQTVRMDTFRRAGERARPLVDAIQAFERDRGAPPGNLSELVPNWIAAIPPTGLWGYPEFSYRPAEQRGPLAPTWALRIFCGQGALNFDTFVYYADGEYDGVGARGGGTHELLGDWAYVHE